MCDSVGMASYPQVLPRQRLPDPQRAEIGRRLRSEYERGASIRELCETSGYSIGRVRRLLTDAGTTFRTRGGHKLQARH